MTVIWSLWLLCVAGETRWSQQTSFILAVGSESDDKITLTLSYKEVILYSTQFQCSSTTRRCKSWRITW